MRLFLFIIFIVLTGILPVAVQAQDISEADTVDMGFLLRKEKSGNIMLHTLGYGFGYRFGTNKTYFKNRMFEFDLLEMRAPNQVRRYNENFPNPRSYVYGKLNTLFILRAGIGSQHLINRKPYWGGIELRLLYMGGVSLAFAKPVYLVFWDETITFTKVEKYNPNNPYHDEEYIIGRAPFTEGLGEIKIYPGIYVKGGLNFEFGALNSKIRALEVGGVAEFFPKAIPIMAFNPEQNFIFTFYLNFSLGKRYN